MLQYRVVMLRALRNVGETHYTGLPPLTARQDAPKVFFPPAPSGNISSRQPPDRAKISQHDTRRATIVWCKGLCETTPLLRAITFQQGRNINMINGTSFTISLSLSQFCIP